MRWSNILHSLTRRLMYERVPANDGDDDDERLQRRRRPREWQSAALLLAYVAALVGLLFSNRFLLLKNKRMLLTLPRGPGWDMRAVAADIQRDVARYPQNRRSATRAGGRYVHFANQLHDSGLNNLLQEMLFLAELARAADRAMVARPVLLDRYASMPSQTFLAGPAVGGPFDSNSTGRRAISVDKWDEVCPPGSETWYSSTWVKEHLGVSDHSEGDIFMERWATWLRELDEPCVEIRRGTPLVFDFPMITSPQVISLFPTMSTSPVTTLFSWSPIVLRAFSKTLTLIASPTSPASDVVEGLAALHVRRGDFMAHCTLLQTAMQGYNSWNLLPSLPDKFDPCGALPSSSPTCAFDERDAATTAHFQAHCLPSTAQMVERIRSLDLAPSITRLYIMTNGKLPFIRELSAALEGEGFTVVSSRDVACLLEREETVCDQAVDMEIARRAEVFIGNGFSSLTSNVVLLRLAAGRRPDSVRFW